MKYFNTATEFVRDGFDWFPEMNPELLDKLDQIRGLYGSPIIISPAGGAIGRHAGTTQHNVDRYGKVNAIDVMFKDLKTSDDALAILKLANEVGFTGIGVYPEWKPYAGFHFDVRTDRTPDNPAMWSGVRNDAGVQIYIGFYEGLKKFGA